MDLKKYIVPVRNVFLVIVVILVLALLETKLSVFSKAGKFFFVKSKLEMVETPSIIQKVVGINELISAEYCSETYCSFDNKPVFEVGYYIQKEKVDNLYIYEKVKNILLNYAKAGIPDSRLSEQFSTDPSIDHLRDHKQFGLLLQLCAAQRLNDKLLEIKNKSRDTYTGRKFKNYYKDRKKALEALQDNKNADIVYIGRGCVQVGVDFQEFNEQSISVTEDGSLIIKGLQVGILSNSINPWFIPNKIPGFEFWDSKKERDLNYMDVTDTKSKCLENLRTEALGVDVKLNGLKSTITSLAHLLNAMNRKYDKYIVETPIHDYLYESIVADSLITQEEILKLNRTDAWITQELDSGVSIEFKDSEGATLSDLYDKLIQFCQRRNQIDPIHILDQLVLQKSRIETP